MCWRRAFFSACSAHVGRGVWWFFCCWFVVLGWARCSEWGHWVERLWQMHYALLGWVWDWVYFCFTVTCYCNPFVIIVLFHPPASPHTVNHLLTCYLCLRTRLTWQQICGMVWMPLWAHRRSIWNVSPCTSCSTCTCLVQLDGATYDRISCSPAWLGALEFLALACTWLAFFLRWVTVGAYAVHRCSVRGVGVLTHHCLEVGKWFIDQVRGPCARCRCILEEAYAIDACQLLENELAQSRVVHVVVHVLLI